MVALILRSIIIYCIVLFSVRLMGKRQIGDMQPFELVVTLIIADLACIPISDISIPIIFGIVPLFTLIIFHYIFTLLNRKSILFRKIVNGKPIILVDENGINYEALKKLNMTLNDLTEGLRANECFNINDIAYAIVETNGSISILQKKENSPVTISDMKLPCKVQASLSIIIINEGKIVKENLEVLNISNEQINTILKKEKINSISQILIMSITKNGDMFLQEKNKKAIYKNIKDLL